METEMYEKKYRLYSSLNRTMQYGNYFFWVFFRKNKKCLNRTMQYGNDLNAFFRAYGFFV